MKKFSLSFSELGKVLGFSNTVLSDKSVDEKMKNIIFMVHGDTVSVVGYNVFTFHITELDNAEVEDIPDAGWEFQVKSSDLNKIMSSFSSLYKTKVDKIVFMESGVKIGVEIHEEPINEEDARLAQVSTFTLENAPILNNVLKEIHMEFPQDLDLLTSGDLLLYLDSLFPLLSNDSASSVASKMNFADDYVFVITSSMSAFFVNKLPDAFKNLTLSYSSVNFLRKLCENEEQLGVARIDKYICIESGNTKAFMKYQKVKVNYKMYVDKRSKEKGIVVDRLYLKDVLKRMGNVSPDGKMFIQEDNNLQVVNEGFQQVIPLNKVKEGTVEISFNVSIPIMDKIIIGKDDVFKNELFIYFTETARGYIMYMSDQTGAWFSNTQVTRA